MKKYELVFSSDRVGDEENSILTLEELKNYTLELAQENKFELVDSEGWIEFINPGEKIIDGYELLSFKENLSEETVFALCSQILEVLELEVYKIFEGFKTRISFFAVIPGSEKDDDQILYQMGYTNGSYVSEIELYVNDLHIANYGSKVCGEQKVYCQFSKDGKELVEFDGEYDIIQEDPKLLLEAHKKQKADAIDYLYYDMNCWLEAYFEDLNEKDISVNNYQLQADAEFVHSSIKEMLNISDDTVKEIVNTLKNTAQFFNNTINGIKECQT